MKKINIEGVKVIDCKECTGSGQILAPASLKKAACIFCNGKGSTYHGSDKMEEPTYQAALKIVWDFINGKENGWYN
jgi:DnaJ-class molecular chaperone|tara:strand:+ start:11952 stop:12179 length:228 start_codon:yes stop_codon:yes gene_type:complete